MMKRFKYPLEGFRRLLNKDIHFLLHVITSIIVLIISVIFKLNSVEWLLIISAIFLVLITEALNTAIEEVVDLTTNEYQLHAKYAKDVASFAVLLSSLYAMIIGVIIFLPKILKLLGVF